MVCLLPFKANTAKQSHGAGRGADRQTDDRPPPCAPYPSSDKPDTKEAASDNTNSTMIGSDGSQSAAKKWWRDYRLLFLAFFASADRRRGEDWRRMWRKLLEEVFKTT